VVRSPLDDAKLLALGRAVRELRARRYLSQEGLGFDAGVHRNRVGAVERGEANLTFLGLFKILVGLRVPLEEFAVVWDRHYARLRAEAAAQRRAQDAQLS
jgi:transcriptional regulator with XRE-family HTH domain